jgi:hypothetical protein
MLGAIGIKSCTLPLIVSDRLGFWSSSMVTIAIHRRIATIALTLLVLAFAPVVPVSAFPTSLDDFASKDPDMRKGDATVIEAYQMSGGAS